MAKVDLKEKMEEETGKFSVKTEDDLNQMMWQNGVQMGESVKLRQGDKTR